MVPHVANHVHRCIKFGRYLQPAELEQIFFESMSNSDFIVVKEGQLEDGTIFNIMKKPTLKLQLDECHQCQVQQDEAQDKDELIEDEELSGFRTPTSLDCRIPVTKQCPPAPRKPRPSLKRKAFNSNTHKNLIPLDLSKDDQSLFPTSQITTALSSDSHNKRMKKARREDCDDDAK
ncbi:Cyclin-dependent protein kinase inhibitor SMR3 [Quillaja saponaria]|uniref:Cyclin-dependent protein kinase inhibitor SMR3 n=1 Tax=Quillaja saponaria TaxID=32244 RepID=A0AAD7PD21_QUISA|nr:Cyclin-dependent protein kinase inhibitor SMR3 [Quillaja saponaria]